MTTTTADRRNSVAIARPLVRSAKNHVYNDDEVMTSLLHNICLFACVCDSERLVMNATTSASTTQTQHRY